MNVRMNEVAGGEPRWRGEREDVLGRFLLISRGIIITSTLLCGPLWSPRQITVSAHQVAAGISKWKKPNYIINQIINNYSRE